MKSYWDGVASREDANWQIARQKSNDEFYRSGEDSARLIFGSKLELLPSAGRILEIGCGKGRIIRWLAGQRQPLQCFGLDVSKEMVHLSWDTDRESFPTNLHFAVGSGMGLEPFPDNFFDAIYSFVVFQHMPRHYVRSTITDARRALKPGGQLTFQVQSRSAIQEIDPPDTDFRTIRYYTPKQAVALVADGFAVKGTRGKPDDHNFFVDAVKK
jgi:ubiquinone/menaquinone biosynthesis C-methylase UbiE